MSIIIKKLIEKKPKNDSLKCKYDGYELEMLYPLSTSRWNPFAKTVGFMLQCPKCKKKYEAEL